MPYCPDCCSEYRAGFAHCSECRVDLVAELPPERPESGPPSTRWVPVYWGDYNRAEVLRGSLEAAGIDTLLPGEHLQMLGWFAPTIVGMARLLVPEADREDAQEIAQALKRGRSVEIGPPAAVLPAPEATAEKQGVAESPGLSPSSTRGNPAPVPVPTLVFRAVADAFLAVSLPCVAVAPFEDGYLRNLGKTAVSILIFYPVMLGLCRWRRRTMTEANEPLMPLWRRDVLEVPLGLLAGGLLVGLSVLYGNGVQNSYGESIWSSSHRHISPVWCATLLFFGVVCAPLFEERFFRGGILASFLASGKGGWGVLVSAFLFSVSHLSPTNAPLFFLDGLVLAWLFCVTRGLIAPIIAHALVNAILIWMSLG